MRPWRPVRHGIATAPLRPSECFPPDRPDSCRESLYSDAVGSPTQFSVWHGTRTSSTNCERPVQPLNRLEDRIRTLSEELLRAEGEEFQRIAMELRATITAHIERLRSRLAEYPLPNNRRSEDGKP